MSGYPELPDEIEAGIARARRLEWWSLFWMTTIVGAMYLVLGSSQAMQAAWVEDLLGLIPPILFLVSSRIERWQPSHAFPYGFHRVGSLTYLVAACALIAMGLFLIYEAGSTLLKAEHPTVESVSILGREVWLGWLMIAVLVYSAIPPVILGRKMKRLAPKLADKLLYSGADMMSADWRTALAAIAGITGIYFGYWWADAVAAGLISLSIILDGYRNLHVALAELMDGAPREPGTSKLSQLGERIRDRLAARNPGAEVRVRQTGRFIRAVIAPDLKGADRALARDLAGESAWQLVEVSREVGPEGAETGTAEAEKS